MSYCVNYKNFDINKVKFNQLGTTAYGNTYFGTVNYEYADPKSGKVFLQPLKIYFDNVDVERNAITPYNEENPPTYLSDGKYDIQRYKLVLSLNNNEPVDKVLKQLDSNFKENIISLIGNKYSKSSWSKYNQSCLSKEPSIQTIVFYQNANGDKNKKISDEDVEHILNGEESDNITKEEVERIQKKIGNKLKIKLPIEKKGKNVKPDANTIITSSFLGTNDTINEIKGQVKNLDFYEKYIKRGSNISFVVNLGSYMFSKATTGAGYYGIKATLVNICLNKIAPANSSDVVICEGCELFPGAIADNTTEEVKPSEDNEVDNDINQVVIKDMDTPKTKPVSIRKKNTEEEDDEVENAVEDVDEIVNEDEQESEKQPEPVKPVGRKQINRKGRK